MECDVLIVGSGPLGVTAARRLAEQGRTVHILEQGPAISEPAGSHVRNNARFHDDPDSYLGVATSHLDFFDDTVPRDHLPGAAVTKCRGGQGVIWTNLCPHGLSPWGALSPEQWGHYYGIAEQFLAVQADGFETSIRQQRIKAKLNASLDANGRNIAALPVAAQFRTDGHLHYSAPNDILAGSVDANSRVQISTATVDKLVGNGPRITGVIADNETITAKNVIVAAGAIGTPQLLHKSGICPPALGRYLSYHPLMVAQIVLDEGLCAAPSVADREPRLQIPPSKDTEWYTLILRDVSPFEPTAPDVSVDPNRLVEIQGICPVDIDEKKRIQFDNDSRPSFDVTLSDADEARTAGALADTDELTSLLGRYRGGCLPTWMPFGFAHMTGTTRMSETDDGTGVADFKGRVWGFDNLYLATNGLIPTRMAVNPTLTGVALATYVADALMAG